MRLPEKWEGPLVRKQIYIAGRTDSMNMRNDDAHGADVEDPLDEAVPALVGHADKGGDAARDGRNAYPGRTCTCARDR